MRGYEQLPGLRELYFEDSWVLSVEQREDALDFRVDAVLTESHPEWAAPKPGEAHAYKQITLRFPNPEAVEWLASAVGLPATDATGEADFGHIDRFVWEHRTYELEGDWGQVRVTGDVPVVRPAASA